MGRYIDVELQISDWQLVKALHPAELSNLVYGLKGCSWPWLLFSCQSLHFFCHRAFSYLGEGSPMINMTTSCPHVHSYLCKHQITSCPKKGLKSLFQVQQTFLMVEVCVTDPRAGCSMCTELTKTHASRTTKDDPKLDHPVALLVLFWGARTSERKTVSSPGFLGLCFRPLRISSDFLLLTSYNKSPYPAPSLPATSCSFFRKTSHSQFQGSISILNKCLSGLGCIP